MTCLHGQSLSLLLIVLLPAPGASGQKPKEAATKTVVTPAGEVRLADAKEASKISERFKRLVLSRKARKTKRGGAKESAGLLTRLNEVEALSGVQHPSFVRLLEKAMLNDPSDAVRIKAADALLAQPKRQVVSLASKLIGDREMQKRGSISSRLIKILAFYGAKDRVWHELYRDFLELGQLGQIALLDAIGERKDWEALKLLLDNHDEPKPAWVDDPNNPPASYWKARWEKWSAFKPALEKALEALLGREFATSAEAKQWIAKQGGERKLRKKRRGK